LQARGPSGQELTIDWVHLGAERPDRLLIVMSGVHGVEGFVTSRLQCEFLAGIEPDRWAPGYAVLVLHAVNPWGMAWGRRQNESNVDLNRNWRRDELAVVPTNLGYDELHPLLCPDVDTVPDPDVLVTATWPLVENRGMRWVRDAIATGQYSHPDGFHFGGDRTEESTHIVESVVAPLVAAAGFVATMDLHTGHGEYGSVTLLSDAAVDSPQDRWMRAAFGAEIIEATGRPDGGVGRAVGQIANGFRDLVSPGAEAYATSVEFGTASDIDQLLASQREMWVHHHGDRADPVHAATIWQYRCCFTPDDPGWEQAALGHGRRVLRQSVEAALGE